MPRCPSVLAIALTALVLTGCGGGNDPKTAAEPTEKTYAMVTNQGFLDINLYIMRGSARTKIGYVSGNSSVRIEIPRTFVNPGLPVRFLADPVGSSRTPYSMEIPIFPGETITIRIPPI